MQCGDGVDRDGAGGEGEVEAVAASGAALVEEMQVVPGHGDPLLIAGAEVAGECPGDVGERGFGLPLGGLGQRRIRLVLSCDGTCPDGAEMAGDPDGIVQIGARNLLGDKGIELLVGHRRVHGRRGLRTEVRHRGERCLLGVGRDPGGPVRSQLITDSVEDDHLAVEAVEGPQPEVTVGE